MTFEHTVRLMGWIYLHFGRAGQFAAFFAAIGVLVGILWLIQRLPLSKDKSP